MINFNSIEHIIELIEVKPKMMKEKLENDELIIKEQFKMFLLGKCEIYLGNIKQGKDILIFCIGFCEKYNWILVEIYLELGLIEINKDNVIEGMKNYFKALEIAFLLKDKSKKNYIFCEIGNLLNYLWKFDEAVYVFNQIDIDEARENFNGYLKVLRGKVLINNAMKEIEKSKEYYDEFLSLKTNEKAKNNMLYKGIKKEIEYSMAKALGKNNEALKIIETMEKNKFYFNNKLKILYIRQEKAFLEKDDIRFSRKVIDILNEAKKLNFEELQYAIIRNVTKNNCIEKFSKRDLIKGFVLIKKGINKDIGEIISLNIDYIIKNTKLKKKIEENSNKSEGLTVFKREQSNILSQDLLIVAFNDRYVEENKKKKFRLSKKTFTIGYIKVSQSEYDVSYFNEVLVNMTIEINRLLGNNGYIFRKDSISFFFIYEHETMEEGKKLYLKIRKYLQEIKNEEVLISGKFFINHDNDICKYNFENILNKINAIDGSLEGLTFSFTKF